MFEFWPDNSMHSTNVRASRNDKSLFTSAIATRAGNRPQSMNRISFFPGIVLLVLFGCASGQVTPESLSAADKSSAEVSSNRDAAVAEIREKAAAARLAEGASSPDVYRSFGPPDRERRTYAEVKAIEAELRAIAEAEKQASSVDELAVLRRRAAHLEALRREAELDAETATGSIDP